MSAREEGHSSIQRRRHQASTSSSTADDHIQPGVSEPLLEDKTDNVETDTRHHGEGGHHIGVMELETSLNTPEGLTNAIGVGKFHYLVCTGREDGRTGRAVKHA